VPSRGFEAASVETIASQAGVSKVTLYKHFPDKTALFEAAVRREMERIEAAQRVASDAPDLPLPVLLRAFGMGIMTFLAQREAIDFYSVLAGELRRHPKLARAFYDLGPGRTRANLAAVIAEAHTRGEIDAPDAEGAAEALFGLWQGFSNFQLALSIDEPMFKTGLETRVNNGVLRFMRAFARQ
jgi:TetR/AcrR family transcriptional regulator, mexJK operon transcriptional repressor